MYEQQEIARLHEQGYCTAYISIRLKVSSAYVRQVVAVVEGRKAIERSKPDGVRRARRAKAESKQAEALRALKEAAAELAQLACIAVIPAPVTINQL